MKVKAQLIINRESFAGKVRVQIIGVNKSGNTIKGMSKSIMIYETTPEEIESIVLKAIEEACHNEP